MIQLVMDRLYTIYYELKKFLDDDKNHRNNSMSINFVECFKVNLKIRCPDFGGDRNKNCFKSFLNPCTKGVHLKEIQKFQENKDILEEKIKEWKKEEKTGHDSQEDGTEPPKKLSAAEILKKRVKQDEEA